MTNKVVGILSMQRVINYGSFLQAYALKKLLKQAGAKESYFIDIENGIQLKEYDIKHVKGKNNLVRFFSEFFSNSFFFFLKKKGFFFFLKKKFRNQYYKMLELEKKNPDHFDLVVIGSDEVFNFSQKTPWGFSPQLYGEVENADKVASYAGSFGNTTLNKIKEQQLTEKIASALKSMIAISVRDKNSAEIVYELTNREALIHLDPVLVYDFSKEVELTNKPNLKNYIIIYSYQDRIHKEDEIEAICNFAKENNKKLVSIFCVYSWCDKCIIPDTPFDVLTWFKHADYVITDTFHGTIFSIINKTKFCSLIRDTNKEKLGYLLEKFHLDNRIAHSSSKISSVLNETVNYEKADEVLIMERERTLNYLKDIIC